MNSEANIQTVKNFFAAVGDVDLTVCWPRTPNG